MPIPDPLTPAALSAGVLTNIATDILKYHAQTLEGTLVGRMLKSAGLIEPDFDDRLREALSKALNLYFETYSQYQLTGIAAFFRDPTVARQIGGYILDRKPIAQDQIQHALDRHLRSDGTTRILIKRRGLELEHIVPDFLKCYHRVLNEQLSVPQMAILLEIVDQTDTVITEMRASEERLKAVVQQVTGRLDAQAERLDNIDAGLKAIRQHLGLDRPQAVIVEEIRVALDAAPLGAMFERGGLCSGYPLKPMPDRYFVAQEFSPDRDDLRGALSTALAEFGVQPIWADDFLWSGHILCKISALIQSTPFGVYQLTAGQNRNVYLELGIAIGLGRPFVLVKDKDAEVSPLAEGLEYYSIDSYLELRYELGQKVRPFLADIANYHRQALPLAGSKTTAAIAHGNLNVVDFCASVTKVLAENGLTPAILGDPTSRLTHFLNLEGISHHLIGGITRMQLDEVVTAIQTARFGIYRIDENSAPDTFLALGISMGLNRPGLLVYHINSEPPSDLKGLSALKLKSFSTFGQPPPPELVSLIRKYG